MPCAGCCEEDSAPMTERRIRVLVAEDSQVTRAFLVHLLEADPRIRVVGAVGDGQAAIDFVGADPPDVVLMDINMPRVDGFEATRRIMETRPVPIVVCSAVSNTSDVVVAFRAMEAGAIACIEKPVGIGHADFAAAAAHLLQTVKLMSEVKVVRRSSRPPPVPAAAAAVTGVAAPAQIKVVGIGASTGGPPVLQAILAELPEDFPAPVLVVQHIAHGFLAGMAQWLGGTSRLPLHIGSHEAQALAGHVYLAPDHFHMGIDAGNTIILTRHDAENHVRPAVSFLFRTIARTCAPDAVGVLLTGMGKDGAAELKAMKDRGATTIAQDRETSVVYGMPGEAVALGGATHVLPADRIAETLVALVRHRNGTTRS